jgi:hypothetical protein
MADIFISYRRDDSGSATGRLADGLQAAFGEGQVFRDLDSIAPGQDFEAALARAVGGARVMLAVIGSRWTNSVSPSGTLRLDDPQDFVRRELEAGLEAGIAVIPVLVEGAAMPPSASLPPSLAPFARCQAVALHDVGWADDVARLANELRRRHGLEPSIRSSPNNRAGAVLLEGLELLGRPLPVIVRLAGVGGRDMLTRAVILLTTALVLGNALIGSALSLGWELLSWILSGTVVCLVACALLAPILALGWRLTGLNVGWQRASTGAACLLGGGWMYLSAGFMCFALGLALAEPGVFTTMLSRWRSGDPAASTHALTAVHGPALAGIVVSTVVWLGGLAWTISAWNGLNVAFGARVWQSCVAATFFGGLLLVLGLVATWAAG